jgi:hypothetical protein
MVLEGSTHDHERTRVVARLAEKEDRAQVLSELTHSLRVVHVLHVGCVAVNAQALKSLKAREQPLSVGGEGAVIVVLCHLDDGRSAIASRSATLR